MPKAVRKSVSRCSSRSSSRNSNRSSCRKRHSPRDNLLISIREAVRSSSAAGLYNTLKRESPLPQTPVPVAPKTAAKTSPEVTIRKVKPEAKLSKQAKLPKASVASDKPRGLIEHGIRYIMLPLHLFHLCVWGSPSASSPETKETQTSPLKLQETAKKSSSASAAKNSSRRALVPSPTSSTSGFSSCSSNFSKVSRVASTLVPSTSSSDSSEVPKSIASTSSTSVSSFASARPEESSSRIRAPPSPRRILHDRTIDDSSDEMVTADEYLDDSSNDRWSSAESSPSMNMSIDCEANNSALERISSNFHEDNSSTEEPMDVSVEETSFNVKQSFHDRLPMCNFRSNSPRRTERISSASSISEERRSSYGEISSSSADREIAGIFRRASPSPSSSDDEDHWNGRRNNPFTSMRKKRTTPCGYDDASRNLQTKRINRDNRELPEIGKRSSESSKIKESREDNRSKKITDDSTKVSNQTDSAYSDEDVEMNSINDTINVHLQSFAMPSLQESVIEWMDQDLDYVADTEDSNDGSSLPERSRISSAATNFRSKGIEIGGLPVGRNIASPEVPKNFIVSTKIIDESSIKRSTAKPEVEMNTAKKSLGTIASPEVDAWRKNFGVDSTNYNGAIAGRGPPGFPEMPQHPPGTKCHCGNPKCFFLPVALPIDDSSSASWNNNYPRAPSPLRHLYYDYPEFMIPPRETIGDKKSPYILVPANLVLP